MIDWFDLLAVQGTLKSLPPTPQFKSINSSLLSLLYVQLSHPFRTTGKTVALTRQIFVSKVMSLLFNPWFTGEETESQRSGVNLQSHNTGKWQSGDSNYHLPSLRPLRDT